MALFAACVLCTSAADAENGTEGRTLAIQLFDEAEALFERGETAKACPKYAESYRLEPQLGALIYLAECLERNGQLASAWGGFREAEELAAKRGDPRVEHARQRARALEPQLSYLVIQVDTSPSAPDLLILRDGATVAPILWGGRAAVDPGSHRIEARARGRTPWHRDVVVPRGPATVEVKVPSLQVEAAKEGVTQKSAVGANVPALVLGGVGVLAVGAGGYFGLSAHRTLSKSEDECNEQGYCTARGVELRDSARSKALLSTVSTSVGVAAVVVAVVLYLRAPTRSLGSLEGRRGERTTAWSLGTTPGGWGLEVNHAF